MIWFLCKKCDKKHSRPDNEGGAMVFCSCGNGLRVPFASTAPPGPDLPEVVPVAQPAPRPVPTVVPVPVPVPPAVPKRAPAPAAKVVPVPVEEEDGRPASIPLPAEGPPLAYRKAHRRFRKVDPHCCWHHEEARSGGTCAACKLPFCIDCLIDLNGQQVCGPCKNFRTAAIGQPLRTLSLASVGLVCSLVAAPVTFLLSLAGAGAFFSEGSVGAGILLTIVGLLMPIGAMITSAIALGRLEKQPRLAGRGMAAGGLCVSMASLAWGLTVLAVLIGRYAGR